MGNMVIDAVKAPLLTGKNRKALDTGTGRITVSINPAGLVHSINRAHPDHGFITLSAMEQFSNDQWFNSDFVRRYRKELAESEEGFGIIPKVGGLQKEIYYVGRQPCFFYKSDQLSIESTYYPVNDGQSGFLVQVIKITNHSAQKTVIPVEIGGIFSLNRCSYGQLTEGGPIPVPASENDVHVEGNRLSVRNRHLPARADLTFYRGGEPLGLNNRERKSENKVAYRSMHEVAVEANDTEEIISVITLSDSLDAPEVMYDDTVKLLKKAKDNRRGSYVSEDQGLPFSSYIINRNIEYVLSCCAVPGAGDSVCLITDHQLLPLSWNRDSFYMVDFLLQAVETEDVNIKAEEVKGIVKGHLIWMYQLAERPEGFWGRAYLTNGFCKDRVFQLDQQCYPLLELCRYAEVFGDAETVKELAPIVGDVLQTILHHKAEEKWLFSTGETPADDKVDYPYHFSSQVLVWHTLNKLASLNSRLPFTDLKLKNWADGVRKDCFEAFSTVRNGKPVFAYLTDLQGHFQFYHDANDLPTVLAPIWGFCHREDAVWINTMESAFTLENRNGYYEGEFSGLGSVHTPHPWPLGDGQELLYSQLTGQSERLKNVWKKLTQVVQWDGLFSEAIDENTGSVASRHWFSWPGAFISTVLFYIKENKL